MKTTMNIWLLLADDSRGRLLRAHRDAAGRIRLDDVASLEDTSETGEHHRPTAKRDLRQGGLLAPRHEMEEHEHRFAVMVGGWVEQQMREHTIDRIVVLTPPRFLGVVRKAWPNDLLRRCDIGACELINASVTELREHPAVVERIHAATCHAD